ncbi:MAG: porin family protein [Candidatus Marinimicrobia bacterium]|nr:porin family protein [Candidatus Neomarinimicrobiota bacterium]
MKIRKKYLIFALGLLLSMNAFAQTFGIKGGLNLATMLERDDSAILSENYTSHASFHFGLSAEIPLSGMLFLETDLLFSGKGYHYFEGGNILINDFDAVLNIYYLDVPVLAKIKYDLESFEVFGTLGPYLAIGVAGNYRYDTEVLAIPVSDTTAIEWGSDINEYKTLDMGLSIGGGIAYEAIEIGISYQLGLLSTSNITTDNYIRKNRVLAISLAYKLNI